MRYAYFGPFITMAAVMICGLFAATASAQCYGYGQGYGYGYGNFPWHTTSPYSAPACFAPGYGYTGPGCVPWHTPSCCDHIWDGYCNEHHGCNRCPQPCPPPCGPPARGCAPVTGNGPVVETAPTPSGTTPAGPSGMVTPSPRPAPN
ncbi:MAG TPA: hypothetical protein VJL29_06580 [Thermoguttaceae bacterium]|nr:hypothetical protein [Thermoguttaceae bacterium]